MFSRHVPTRRVKSGVLFSAPDDTERAPPDEKTRRSKKQRFKNLKEVIPADRKKQLGKELALSDGPADHEESIAMFARYLDPSPFSPADHPEGCHIDKQDKETLCLPVLKVSLTATVEGTLAHMTLLQSFHNPSNMTIKEARHIFPLYDGSAVIAFECTIGDERRLRGVVKPKEQARKEYKQAVHEQAKAAALLEEHTPEIFETSLGNIPPLTTVDIKIVYIQELKVVMMESEVTEAVALIIPTSLAPHYKSKGKLPSEHTEDRLNLEILVLKDDHVDPDGCQQGSDADLYYHGIKLLESPQRSSGEYPVNEYHFWEQRSESPALKKDLVFLIAMKEGHEIQSRALLSQPDESGLAAMMVSIRPNELFRNAISPQAFSGELLFLLDQSGSMDDWVGSDEGSSESWTYSVAREAKIDILREAMHLVLAGLPKTCSFNIISWGSETWALWEQSRQHTPDNPKEAKEYVSEIMADMGGTDLLRALKSTVQRRLGDGKPTQIIVLTDGALDPQEPMEFVWRTRQKLQNKVRFFALGIGDYVPRSLIEGIAELGGGFGDIVDTAKNPKWHARLNRLTKSALEPDSWDCGIDIGPGFKKHSFLDSRINRNASASQVPYFQAPCSIAGLHPFRFSSVFFLIDTRKNGLLPSEVTVTTTTEGAKTQSYRLPVKPATGHDGTMHRLAAKAALMDLEDVGKRQRSSSRIVEENAQTLGLRYSITSKWTSFVAVPQDEPEGAKGGSIMEHYKALMDGIDISELLDGQGEEYSESSEDDGFDDPEHHGSEGYAGVGGWAEVGKEDLGLLSSPIIYGGLKSGANQAKVPAQQRDEWAATKEPVKSAGIESYSAGYVFEYTHANARPRSISERNDTFVKIVAEHRAGAGITVPQEQNPSHEGLPESSGSKMLKSLEYSAENSSREGSVTQHLTLTIDPLNWEVAVKYQKGEGLFDLPEETRKILQLHFCVDTRLMLAEKLADMFYDQELDSDLWAQIIDTLMMVKCYQTHLAHNEDIWDLMMERAQDAIAELRREQNAKMKGLQPVHVGVPHVFEEWIEFWQHQQEYGHMVCPR
ncbi:hypothetical protein LB507_008586 [Fusarium sp. FIESC RH6]|nr:hypothetical protein LB507_008586 [Fusarium sp. FIESC RH6]